MDNKNHDNDHILRDVSKPSPGGITVRLDNYETFLLAKLINEHKDKWEADRIARKASGEHIGAEYIATISAVHELMRKLDYSCNEILLAQEQNRNARAGRP